ncbi:MAG: glycerophosphodiester phosphodiesterase [Chloroflexota bacterium]
MRPFEIVAHRGVTDEYPENTIPAFERAIELGADSVELDVRLTSDHVPVVFHYFYLDEITPIHGTIFNYTFKQLKSIEVVGTNKKNKSKISTLSEVLEAIGGKIGLEIEIKGPELESVKIIADTLSNYKSIWDSIEITSYEPLLLIEFQKLCPDIPTDLLLPHSESWMKLDVVTYIAIHRSRLAQARAVHLHPTQLAHEVISNIRKQGIQIHAWDVNDEQSLKTCAELEIQKICTDKFQQAKTFRQSLLLAS